MILDTKDVILELRNKRGLSQDELAEKLYVTRQAVSRWENGETIPNTETLKLLSAYFDVSINTLLGSPRQLICQCCGMPLDDSAISRETDGTFNEEYCKWCYADGRFTYQSMEELIRFCAEYMANESWSADQVRAYMSEMLPKLNHWKSSTGNPQNQAVANLDGRSTMTEIVEIKQANDAITEMVALFRVELCSYKGISSKPSMEAGRAEIEECLSSLFRYLQLL